MNEHGHIELSTFWLPRQSSTIAHQVDFAWNVVTLVSIFFFVLVVGAMLIFVWRYRRRTEHDITSTVEHNFRLEVAWTILPLAICIGLFVVGFRGYVNASVPPGDALEIKVVATQWAWDFIYPNGTKSRNEFRMPAGRPVKVIMSAADTPKSDTEVRPAVIHSFFIPEFRVKQDVVPGLYTTLWFTAPEPLDTILLCTEYCGDNHSKMSASVKVMENAAFNEWMENGGDDAKGMPPAEHGLKLYSKYGCNACHTIDGSPRQAPSFKGLFGRKEAFNDGSEIAAVDENYIRESILNPTAKVVKGYQGIMPMFKGVVTDKEVDDLIAFIKTLK